MNNLGKRIKENYEHRNRYYLIKRMPVIIRLDGKAFHTFTAKLNKPFDTSLIENMVFSATNVLNSIQGAKCAYVQSDEVSILMTDYDTFETCGWYDYNKSKIESVSASIMTAYFNKGQIFPGLAFFDSRAFNIPREEVVNYFLWRAKDWERNSVSMYCNSVYSQKEMHKKSKTDQHEMLYKKGLNWTTDLSDQIKNGTFIFPDGQYTGIKPVYEEIANFLNPLIYCDKK